MKLYAILRRDGWGSADELELAAQRSLSEDELTDAIRWIRSYVFEERAGTLGTVCIYEAESPEAIRRHSSFADLPISEIVAVADTVIVRPDPGSAVTERAA